MCKNYVGADMFAGTAQIPRKIIHFMILGYDTDILEILMEESRDLVDYYVLVEGTKAHKYVYETLIIL